MKGLLDDLQLHEAGPVGVVARSVPNSVSLTRWLEKEGLSCPVLLPASAAENGFFERLICAAWPGSGKFSRVVRKFSAPRVCLIAYPFESQWLHWFGQNQRSAHIVPSMTSPEKSLMLGLSGDAKWPADTETVASTAFSAESGGVRTHSQIDLEQQMTRKGMIPVGAVGEETTPARLVSFSGDAYGFLTDSFRIPVITDLVSGAAGEDFKVPRRSVAEIHAGDVLVFRESGRRDVIHSLADAQLV